MRNAQIMPSGPGLYLFGIVSLVSACTHGSLRSAIPYPSGDQMGSSYEARGTGGVAVATQGKHATAAAYEILGQGGNIADAAVAISFVQSVERPHSTGLGGGGFLLWGRSAQGLEAPKVEAWDFRERAPLAAHSKMYVNLKTGRPDAKLSSEGRLSIGVPGLVAGLYEFHRSYGKLAWKDVLQPAIRLAREGFEVYPELGEALEEEQNFLAKNAAAREIFFHAKEKRSLKTGEKLVQTDLAKTIEIVAAGGMKEFYSGSIAAKILAESRRSRILITKADLRQYEVKMRPVFEGTYLGHKVYSMPPPSSGGLHVLQILNTLENDPIAKWGALDPRSVHLVAASMQQAFADRAHFLGDPDFVEVPSEDLVSKKYARDIRAKIPAGRALKSSEVKHGPFKGPAESDHTIHFSIMDSEGNAISSTQTINAWFGSGIVVRGTGILLNNEMDDFAAGLDAGNIYGAVHSSSANFVEPGKTPLSSMSPTIVERDGQLVMAVGSPAGTKIITCVAQVLMNRIAHGMSPAQSVAQIRYHHQWQPDQIIVDEPGLPEPVAGKLRTMGYKVETKNLGCRVQLVDRDPKTKALTAVSDIRAEGSASVR